MGALANAFRYNYSDLEGCSLLIDLGAKTSNVLLFEKNKFYARSINVGANAITQEFGAEAKLPFAEAKKFKIAEGLVSLGGAYEEPDNPKVAAVSKVARNVLTRLHLQVNQTIQFYRTQQGGAAPVRVFLCGGGSIMPYATQFFQEKLNGVDQYACGFAWVEVYGIKGSTKLGRILKQINFSQAMWNPAKFPAQNIDTLYEGAKAAAAVLKSYGFDA